MKYMIKMLNPRAKRSDLHKIGIWVTADSERIHCSKMKTSHLLNVLQFLINKTIKQIDNTIHYNNCLPYPQGEMAQMEFEREMEFLEFLSPLNPIVIHPFIPFAVNELKTRKLNDDEKIRIDNMSLVIEEGRLL